MTSEDHTTAQRREAVAAFLIVALLLLGFAGVLAWGMRDADAERRAALIRDTSEPQVFEVNAGWYRERGSSEELAAYFPDRLRVHRGDTVRFVNPTVEDPHSVTFGLASDRANQPQFGSGRPLPQVNGPCVSHAALTASSETCDGVTDPSALPPFGAQPYYNSGIIPPGGGTFDLRFADDLALGAYQFSCVIHPGQSGVVELVGDEEPTQRVRDLDAAAEGLLASDRDDLRALATSAVQAPSDLGSRTVQAGAATSRVSVNRFLPAEIDVEVGETVTWVNRGSVPHVMLFNGALPPPQAVQAPPTAPSGSQLSKGLFTTGPIGLPPYPRTSYSLRFNAPGTYGYVCVFHPGMAGSVQVSTRAGSG